MTSTRPSMTADQGVRGTDQPCMDRRTLFRGIGLTGVLAAGGLLAHPMRASAADTSLKSIQTNLQGLDYYDGEIDGLTGPQTKSATKKFQQDRLLSVDGDPGPKTAAELESVIKDVQSALDVKKSGSFDKATTEAVTAFQKKEGLDTTDRADSDTMKALDVERVKEPKDGEPNGKISRDDAIERAMFWVDDPRPYSQTNTSVGRDGKKWRTDCSGFVCMAWNLRHEDNPTGATTGALGGLLDPIKKDDLNPGDALLITPAENGQNYGHVILFNGWKNDDHTKYEGLEQVGGSRRKTTKRTISYPYDTDNGKDYKPYRYPKITD